LGIGPQPTSSGTATNNNNPQRITSLSIGTTGAES